MYNTTSKQKSLIELCLDNTKETFIAGNVIRLSHEKCNIKEGTNIKYYLVISSRQSFENNTSWVECVEILEDGNLGTIIYEFNDTEFKFYISIGTLSVEKYKYIQTLLS